MVFNEIIQVLTELIEAYGYIGILIVSLISNSIPYVSLPYLALLVFMAPFVGSPVLAVLASAFGATIGKVVILFLGRSFRTILSEKTKENLECFNYLFKKWSFIAVFLFASLPLPDDVLYIPLGLSGYRLLPYFIAVFAGKIIVTALAILFGKAFIEIASNYNIPFEISFASLIIITVLITYIAIKVNWKNVVESYNKSIELGVKTLINEIINSFKFKLKK
ncbi:MAG: VTT domain-containing protein [Nitrososphaeria archaeon]|nr:VTT domain-containing protein [Nitrososphaeria archaeon]